MAIDYDKMIRRIEAARANKTLWEDRLRETYKYFLPERNTIDKYSPGQKKDEHVYDATPIESLEDYATRMEGELVPPGRQWMKLEAGTDIDEKQEVEVDRYLEEATDTLFSHINSSNFSSQIHESFLDLGISTGAIIVEEGDGIQSNLRFRSVSLSELILEKSRKGIAETVWRDITVNAADIKSMFPYATLTEEMERDIKEKPSAEYSFIEGVALNEDVESYTSMLLYPKGKAVLFEQELESSPWVVFRETTIPGEVYGRGRAMRCLPAAQTLNAMMRSYLESAELVSSPIYTAVDDGIINPTTIRLRPKTIVPVGSNDRSNPTLNPLPVAGAYEISKDIMEILKDEIRRTMMSKPFGQIDQTPVRTATEMSIRNADLAKTSIGASGRIQAELLERLIKRCVYILKKAGKIADFRVDGREVAIKFTSPSSRQQDESDLATILRFVEIMGGMPPEMYQKVDAAIKTEDFPEMIADIMGIPAALKRDEGERAAKEQQQQQAQALMMMQQQEQMR